MVTKPKQPEKTDSSSGDSVTNDSAAAAPVERYVIFCVNVSSFL